MLAVGLDDGLHHVADLIGRKRWTDHLAGHGRRSQVRAVRPTQGHLVPLGTIFVHAQDADVPTVVVTAGVDAAGDVQVDVADVLELVEVLVARNEFIGDGDRACVGQGAEVAARAGDHVAEQADVGAGQPQLARGQPQGMEVFLAHIGQQQVLVVAHTQLATTEALGQIGHRLHLHIGGVTRCLARTLERQVHARIAWHLVGGRVALQPAGKRALGRLAGILGQAIARAGVGDHALGQGEAGLHAIELGLGDAVGHAQCIVLLDVGVLLLDLFDKALAFSLDQNLDAGLVEVVAPAPAVVDPYDGLDVDQDVLPRHELIDEGGDDGGAAHAAAHEDLEANLTSGVTHQLQADVVPADRGAVFLGADDGDLELARQERKFRVQGRPLAQHFTVGARIDVLVGGDPGHGIGGDVADAIARGLDAVHIDLGQQVHHVGRTRQRNPVVLDILARGEVGVAAVKFARDARQLAQLACRQLAIGNCHAQHRRMALHIPAILQAQRPKILIAEATSQVALELVAELLGALSHEVFVEFSVLVHG